MVYVTLHTLNGAVIVRVWNSLLQFVDHKDSLAQPGAVINIVDKYGIGQYGT